MSSPFAVFGVAGATDEETQARDGGESCDEEEVVTIAGPGRISVPQLSGNGLRRGKGADSSEDMMAQITADLATIPVSSRPTIGGLNSETMQATRTLGKTLTESFTVDVIVSANHCVWTIEDMYR
jgi:hypothetical protein